MIATENPETGVLETDWAEDRAKIPEDFLRKTLGKSSIASTTLASATNSHAS